MPGPMGRGRNPFERSKEKPSKILARLLKYIFRYYGLQYIIVFVCIVVGVLCNVQGTLFTRTLIDVYIMPMIGVQNPDFAPLLGAISRVAMFYLLGIIDNFTRERIMIYVSQGVLMRLRNEMFDHMETLPLRYFDSRTHGEIMSLYTNDIDTLRQMISQSIIQIVNSAITIVTVFISMVSLSLPLTGVTIGMVIVMLVITRKVAGLSMKNFVGLQANTAKLNGFVEETMTGQKVVKVFCHEDATMEQFEATNNDMFTSSVRAHTFASIMMPINGQLGQVSYVLCAVVGGALAFSGLTGLTIGTLASFLTFNRNFNMPISQVSQQLNSIVMAMAGAERIFNMLDEKPETDDGYVTLVNAVRNEDGSLSETTERTRMWAWKYPHRTTGITEYIELKGDVRFEDVDFGYVPERQVLYDISLYAKPGHKIAFVGSTGAGKTTITNLINRFYDITDGKIRYDGINIMKIKKDDLRKSLGIVLQETNLFTGTVRENIRFGRLEATDEEIVEAAKVANADGFIRRLENGYDTMLTGNGQQLSQGERQLLSIARAAVADPPVLILDEATSSIDTRTERIVQEGMDGLMKGRTNFVIAHRLSTVHNANAIMVMENGHIIERGTHDQLIAMEGRYYQLYTGKKPKQEIVDEEAKKIAESVAQNAAEHAAKNSPAPAQA